MLRGVLLVLILMVPGVAPRPAVLARGLTSTQHRALDGSVVLGRVLVPPAHLDAQAWPRGMVIAPPAIDPGIQLAPRTAIASWWTWLQRGLAVLAGPPGVAPAPLPGAVVLPRPLTPA